MCDKKSVAVSPETGKTATKTNGADSEYTTLFSPLSIALTWLERGIPLIPLQPGSKHIIPGFGPYSQHITTADQAQFWFVERRANLGLVCGRGMVVLDFDDAASHARWAASWPGAAASYTEKTRRGYHVHFLGESRSYRHSDGFEVKGAGAVVAAAPAQVGGFVYQVVNASAALQHLPGALSLSSDSPKAVTLDKGDAQDLVARIKAQLSLVAVAQEMTRITSKNGRYWHGKCPLPGHDDKHASFYVDAERGVWGCYACQKYGDVINLWALGHNLSIREAIASLAVGVQQ